MPEPINPPAIAPAALPDPHPIDEIAAKLNLSPDELIHYGTDKAKLDPAILRGPRARRASRD